MKRFITAVTLAAVFCAGISAAEFIVGGSIYNHDGTAGLSSTPNSFAYCYGFRLGVAGQIVEHTGGEEISPCVSPNKVFASNGSIPAYYQTDAGTAWDSSPVAIAEGQVARVVLQVSSTGNCYTGAESYVSSSTKIIGASEMFARSIMLPDCQLKLLPAPAIAQTGMNYINISWTGIDLDNIDSYGIYRDEDGNGNYTLITTVSQARGMLITYTDNDAALAQGKIYTYKLSVRFIWGGGNGAPDYFETAIKSKMSAGAQFLPPTFTITPTYTYSPYSPTQTDTCTMTHTLTQTPSYTQTFTGTYTITGTITETITPTLTVTATHTVTVTLTVSNTATATQTPAATLTPTIMPVLVREKVLVFNNPVRNSRVVLAFLAPSTGQAVIDFYNINAELVRRYKVSADEGANNFTADFKGVAPGIYIIRIHVNGSSLPERKMAVIK